ncbi:MAG TPA: DUF222 domain-containing protein [Acidimicrobiales bacterium]|nr:DUF222 domain-containing protein [Acidimicrobiales bacterium]
MRSFPQAALRQVREFLEDAEPELVTTERAAQIVEGFSELERLASGGKLLFAKRAADSSTWARAGYRSAGAWLAETSGCSVGEAMGSLETSARLAELDLTAGALRRGELSESQTKEIAHAAERDPSKQSELIEAAATGSFKSLKARARKIRLVAASAMEEQARYRAIHRARFCRHFSDEEGAFRLEARLAPDQGARLVAALEQKTNAVFDEARASGTHEPSQAYRADALVALITQAPSVPSGATGPSGAMGATGSAKPSGATGAAGSAKPTRRGIRAICGEERTDTVVVRVDASSLRRGYVKGEETCEIAGLGPVPVATARRILGDCFLKIVIKDALDVASVCHIGRTIPAQVKTALEERDPTCVVCDCAYGLEAHHWQADYAQCRTTSLEGLARLCKHHHDLVTYDGYKLCGGPGKWQLVAPPAPKILDSS